MILGLQENRIDRLDILIPACFSFVIRLAWDLPASLMLYVSENVFSAVVDIAGKQALPDRGITIQEG